jgi:hypothetical protein
MNADEIRKNGINAPGNAWGSTMQAGANGCDPAVAENLGLIAGILLELAAQGAERNEMLRESNDLAKRSCENYEKMIAASGALKDALKEAVEVVDTSEGETQG